MEERNYIEQERSSLGELFGKSFEVFKENWLTYLIAAITIGIIMGAIQGLQFVLGQNTGYKLLSVVINGLAGAAISAIYITTAYNSVRQTTLNVGDTVMEKIFPMFLTQMLLALIMMIPLIALMMILIPMMFKFGASTTIFLVILFPITFFIALKCAFLSQAIVLSDKRYWSAIKWTFSHTKGEVGGLIGIYIMPAIVGVIAFILMRTIGLSSVTTNLVIIIATSLIGGILSIIVSIATTLLYIEVAMPQEQVGETLIYGADY